MAYSELIKNFERVRDYVREFYVYGFKSREEYDAKSARSYDNERRRVESWLGDYLSCNQDANGKNVFLSVDSREITHNPLYKAFKARSFTDNDITLHFYLLDLLADGSAMTVRELISGVEHYFSAFDTFRTMDDSTIRKKLKEYEKLGILISEKRGRELCYRADISGADLDSWQDCAAFFSEADAVGVIGSFLLDKYDGVPEYFGFKHHYILHALDSQVLCTLLACIHDRRAADISVFSRRHGTASTHTVYPAKIYISTQYGRQYLLCYHYRFHKPMFFRLDTVHEVTPGSPEKKYQKYDGFISKLQENLWGVSVGNEPEKEHLEMTVRVGVGEDYILQRLEREKRNGWVMPAGLHNYKFATDVYDAAELLPWIRTFTGRIVSLHCSNKYVEETFLKDTEELLAMYGGEEDAVQ